MQGIRTDRRKVILNILPLVLIILLVLLDQITKTHFKLLATTTNWKSDTIIKDFFYFNYETNSGAAWSFLADKSWGQLFFKILTGIALVLFFIFYVYACKKDYLFLRFALLFVIGGTIGNFIDRLAYNYVVDFISFVFGEYAFPTFNLADSYMTVGVVMVIIHFLFLDKNGLFVKNENKKVSN